MDGKAQSSDYMESTVTKRPGLSSGAKIKGRWEITCRDSKGNLKWTEVIENLVVDEGLNHILDCVLAAGSQITTWYVGLTDASPSPAAGDTMASHVGWVENQNYDEGVRQTWTPGAVSGESVSNTASKATFTMSSDSDTVGGAFLISNSAKGGSTGTLYSAGAFTGGNKSVDDNDTLQVTATFTQADDGV